MFYLGIGRGIAIKLAELGAKVVAVARTQEELKSLQKEVINWCGCTLLYANYQVLQNNIEAVFSHHLIKIFHYKEENFAVHKIPHKYT